MPISEDDFFKVLKENPHIKDVWKTIKKSDTQSNGFLTINELNTIFIQVYPELDGKSLFKILRPFCSIQNKSLINYRKLREYLENRLFAYYSDQDQAEENVLSRNHKMKEAMTFNKNSLGMSPREIRSPSMRRMEQIKDEILRAAESSPIFKANKHLAQRYEAAKVPDVEITKKSTLEALVSPRGNKHYLPKLSGTQQNLRKGKLQMGRVQSPDRESIGTKFSQYSTYSSPFFNKTNEAIKAKLEYEWKNIFRALNSIDINSTGVVSK